MPHDFARDHSTVVRKPAGNSATNAVFLRSFHADRVWKASRTVVTQRNNGHMRAAYDLDYASEVKSIVVMSSDGLHQRLNRVGCKMHITPPPPQMFVIGPGPTHPGGPSPLVDLP